MRITALIAASAAALALTACQRPAEPAADATTEAEEAAGAAADTAAVTNDQAAADAAAAANAGGGSAAGGSSGYGPGESMSSPGTAPTTGSTATAPMAEQPAAAGASGTDTQRRLNPQPNPPAQ